MNEVKVNILGGNPDVKSFQKTIPINKEPIKIEFDHNKNEIIITVNFKFLSCNVEVINAPLEAQTVNGKLAKTIVGFKPLYSISL
ncbi:unnamed protein product [[Candida] boidinii]|nr:unnamed protein product [[Candida] boidinii]